MSDKAHGTRTRHLGIGAAACAVLGAIALLVAAGCSGDSTGNGQTPGDSNGPVANGGTRPDTTPVGESRPWRDPWRGARPGDMAVYRFGTVEEADDEAAAREQRWELVAASAAPVVRTYSGGGVGLFGMEPEVAADMSIEVPPRARGIGARNWWLTDEATLAAVSPRSHELLNGQTLEVVAIDLDDGGTLWVSREAPLDGVVRHVRADGAVQRELIAFGRWLGPWSNEDATYWFRSRDVIVGEAGDETYAYQVESQAPDGTVTLALQDEAGAPAGRLTLVPSSNGGLVVRTDAGESFELSR